MKPSQMFAALEACIDAGQPAYVSGPPGVGKSNIVAQVARKKFGAKNGKKSTAPYFIDLRLPLLDAVDLRGIPVPNLQDKSTVWLPPSFLPRSGEGVLFFDELVQAPIAVQNAASSIILPPHTLGEYTLPEGWAVVAAGNRETDRAGVNRMASHIANRFTHFNLEVDANDWIVWASENRLNDMVIAFIAFRPDLLHKFDPQQKAFPTPRSWEFVSKLLAANIDECLLEIVSGTVGEAAAAEFVAFTRIFREMPDYDLIVKRPDAVKVPENASARYAVATMLINRTEKKDMGAVMKYVSRMPKDFQVLTANDMTRSSNSPELTKRNKERAATSAYINWASDNKDLLLNATQRVTI